MSDRDGIVLNLEEATYHSGPELSSTGAKTLLRAPALYRWQQEHRVEKAAYDFGHVVHGHVLGTGLEVVTVVADNWMTKAAKEARKDAYAAGKVPMLAKDAKRARDAADAVLAHPIAKHLFVGGDPEVSAFWTDEATGVRCRGRFDYLRGAARPVLVDLKTTDDADPKRFGKKAVDFGYDLQTDWYVTAYEAITGERVPFLHALVTIEPPHLVSVIQLDDEALRIGALKAARAREIYRDCTEAGVWPGHPEDIHPVSLPAWAITAADREYA